jgi:CHC2 zinc finger/Toprim-like
MTVTAPAITLAEAKECIRNNDLWREFGFEGEPRKQCRCPFHEDRSPSFSVFDDGKRWKCFAGCGEGDVVDLLALAKGLSNEEACREILRRAGGNREVIRSEQPKGEPTMLELPSLVPYSKEIAQLAADSRGLQITAIEFAALWLKTVVFARVCEQKAWILTDASRKCAEARRIDAKPFPAIDTLAERKSHSLAGSRKSWPVGILPPELDEPVLKEHVHRVILVEGGPDYLAACQIIAAQDVNVLPVAMLGASQTISEDALPYFRDRHVTVVAHADETGRKAGMRWARQVQATGAEVKLITMTTGDLCDAVSRGATNAELELL